MELTVKKSDFLEALARVQSIVERKTTLAVLSNVMLKAQNQSLIVSATDLEIGYEGVFPAHVTKEGSVTVPAKKIFEIVKELSSAEVFVQERDKNWVFLSGGEAKYTLYGLPSDEFPGLPQYDSLHEIEIKAASLRRMIQCTIFSTSSEDTIYNTSGVYLEKINHNKLSRLRMVSTDGHRLSYMEDELDDAGSLNFEKGIVISKKGISEIAKLIEGLDSVKIGFSEKVGMVKTERDLLAMRLLENKFPDYTRVIPAQSDIEIKVERVPFLEMLRRMSIMATERHKAVRLDFKPGLLEIYSTNPDIGDAQEKKEIEYDGPELSMGFNPRYIIEALTILESEQVKILLIDENNGCVLKGEMDPGFLGLVMPMKIN